MLRLQRLRLAGFKSFVEPADLDLAPGLTAVVGPNGCGKSNLVEALRWVMGETAARQMRGTAMDDVIFGGTSRRPGRNVAEVSLSLANPDRDAPARFNDAGELEVVRRIERNQGSTYRVNGTEVRARDVQLLFADTATGARSPALVGQGRITALVNARPSERRQLLEEAAGISGLHTRRHEAELKLKNTESNLARVDDVLSALQDQRQGLQRQARHAARYRRLTEDIERTEALLFHVRWQEALQELENARAAHRDAENRVADLTARTSDLSAKQAEAAADLPQYREAEAEAAAAVQRLTTERDQMRAEARRIESERKALEKQREQAATDLERERQRAAEAARAVEALDAEAAELEAAREGESAEREAAEQQLAEAAETLRQAEAALDEANRRAADDKAQRDALERRAKDLAVRRRHHDGRRESLATERRDLEANRVADAERQAAQRALDDAESALAERQDALADAADRAERARQERDGARRAVADAEAAYNRITAEADGLAAALGGDRDDGGTPLTDAVRVTPGSETALGAALGDDLQAPADPEAAAHWRAHPPLADPPPLPDGVQALADQVAAPPELARRLQATGIVPDVATGDALAPDLAPGQRLVTRDGMLWRWDGYTVRPDAPSPAAARLEQQNRLRAVRDEQDAAARELANARAAAGAAETEAEAAEAEEKVARDAVRAAEGTVRTAEKERDAVERRARDAEDRLAALAERESALAAEADDLAEAERQLAAEQAALPDTSGADAAVAAAREAVTDARERESAARAHRDRVEGTAGERRRRLESIAEERRQAEERRTEAEAQGERLAARVSEADGGLQHLTNRPEEIEQEQTRLAEQIDAAEQHRKDAADRLAEAENRAREADRALKAAEKELTEAREARVRQEAAVDQAERHCRGLARRIDERLGVRPDDLPEKAGLAPDSEKPARDAVEARLDRLLRDRDAMGPVNLRAEQELAELDERVASLNQEREDLTAAIARLRQGIGQLNKEGRDRLLTAFNAVNDRFARLFTRLFGGGRAHLSLTESDDPLAAGLEIMASPPGKKLQALSLLSGGEQALTALALLFAVFLTNPAPVCVLDEVDAPLDDANVDRFCTLLEELTRTTETRFLLVTHHRMTMARSQRLYGVTMTEPGVSSLLSVDLGTAEDMAEAGEGEA